MSVIETIPKQLIGLDYPEMVCELCFTHAMGAMEYGKIAPEIWLFRVDGKYGLMGCDGHEGQEWFYFPEKPTPDPDVECKAEEGPVCDAASEWLDKVLTFEEGVTMKPECGYALVSCCKKGGYKRGGVIMWLWDQAGRLLEKVGDENGIRSRLSSNSVAPAGSSHESETQGVVEH